MREKRNTRWKDMDKSNIDLSQLVSHFEAFNWSEGKSPRTVEWYNHVLNLLLNWLQANGHSTKLGAIDEGIIRDFILYLRNKKHNGKPLSTHTIANRVRALRAFFSWLDQQGYTETNILANLKQPKVSDTVIEPLSSEEINTLFASIDRTSSYGARNIALLALFADTGTRLSEAANLINENVHLSQRYIKVLGKGNKERIIAMGVTYPNHLVQLLS